MIATLDTVFSRDRHLVETFMEFADTLVKDFDVVESLAPRAISAGFRSVQAVPLRLRGDVLSAFKLLRNHPRNHNRSLHDTARDIA